MAATESSDSTTIRDPLVGAKLGDYEVVGPLGEGGMGVVYEGLHTVINKRVAIKVIRPDVAGDQVLVRRLLAEAQAVNAVRHRGIVDIHAHGLTHDGRPYLVMELLHGETLQDLLDRQGRLPLKEVLGLLLKVTGPLYAAHKSGIVHRDLKPSNLFLCLDDDGERFLKLLDFGLAKRSTPGRTSSTMTSASIVVGTPDYIAPEQARAQPTDARTDIYSLGVLAFQLLAGQLPYRGGTPVDLVMMHLTAPVPRLVDVDPSIPPELSALVEQMMAKEPAQRPPSLEPVRAALKQFLAVAVDAAGPVPSGVVDPMGARQGGASPPVAPRATGERPATVAAEVKRAPATPAAVERTVIAAVPDADDIGTAATAQSLSQVGPKSEQRQKPPGWVTGEVSADGRAPLTGGAKRSARREALDHPAPADVDPFPPVEPSRKKLLVLAVVLLLVTLGGAAVLFVGRPRESAVVGAPVEAPAVPVDVAPPGQVDVAPPGQVDVAPPGQVDVAPPGPVDMAPPGQVDVAPPGRVDVAPPGRVDVAPSGQVDVALPGSGADRALPGPTPGPVGAVQPQGLPGANATKPAGVAAPPDQKQMQPVVAPPAPRVETAPVRPSERPQGETSTRPAPTKSAPSVAALKARVEKLRASLVDSSKRLILEKRVAPRLAGPLTEKQRVELAEQLDDLSP